MQRERDEIRKCTEWNLHPGGRDRKVGGDVSRWYMGNATRFLMFVWLLFIGFFVWMAIDDSILGNEIVEDEVKIERTVTTQSIHINIATVFYYANVPEQTDSTPNIMASGNRVYEGAVAVSRDYLKHKILKYGDKIQIEGLGEYVVEDTMNKRHKWSVDVFTFDLEKSHSKPVQRHIYFKPKGE